MYQTFYLSVDPKQIQYDWNISITQLEDYIQKNLPEKTEKNWVIPYLKTYSEVIKPHLSFFKKKYGNNISMHSITLLLSDGIVLNEINLGQRDSNWSSLKIEAQIDELVRVQNILHILILLYHSGKMNFPLLYFFSDDYFLKYLKYRVKMKNYLQYDTRIRKNFVEFLLPFELKNINHNVWDFFNLEYLFHCPNLIDAKIWNNKWQKINEIQDFWSEFTIKEEYISDEEGLNRKTLFSLATDREMRKGKRIHKDDLLMKYFEKSWPKYPKFESPEYLEIALNHLKQIGEIASYAEQNNMWLLKFYI
jgi:hypothetical protein